jgi:hypothetical protein
MHSYPHAFDANISPADEEGWSLVNFGELIYSELSK